MGPPFEPIGEHDYLVSVAVSADGRVAVAYGLQQDVTDVRSFQAVALDIATGRAIGPRMTFDVGDQDTRYNVAVNGDGTRIAVGGGDRGEVQILDLTTGRLVTTIPPPADMLESIQGLDTSTGAWAPDGFLYVGSSGTHLRQFDPVSLQPIRDITVPKIAMGGTLQFSGDGAFVVGAGRIKESTGCPRRSPASTWRTDTWRGRSTPTSSTATPASRSPSPCPMTGCGAPTTPA